MLNANRSVRVPRSSIIGCFRGDRPDACNNGSRDRARMPHRYSMRRGASKAMSIIRYPGAGTTTQTF